MPKFIGSFWFTKFLRTTTVTIYLACASNFIKFANSWTVSIPVTANYIRLELTKGGKVYEYDPIGSKRKLEEDTEDEDDMKQVQLPATRVFKKEKLTLKSTVVTPLVRDLFKTMFVKKNHKNVEWLGEAVTANGKSYYESAILGEASDPTEIFQLTDCENQLLLSILKKCNVSVSDRPDLEAEGRSGR